MAMAARSRYGKGMLILIDGYNVIAPVAPPAVGVSDWLHQERLRLLNRLADHLPAQLAQQTSVVFDAAGQHAVDQRQWRGHAVSAGRGSRFRHRQIDVRFAVGYAEADDLIEELIRRHHSPKRLTVVSSDHRLQQAARRRGALAVDSAAWLDRLLEDQLLLAVRWPATSQRQRSGPAAAGGNSPATLSGDPQSVAQWLQAFGLPEADAPQQSQQQSPDAGRRAKRERGHPRRRLAQDDPFPEGYGEDLL